MQNSYRQMCLRRFDFASYLNGAAYGYEKAAIEQHLCDCDDCFDTLMNVLNQHLNQAHPLMSGLRMTRGRQAASQHQSA